MSLDPGGPDMGRSNEDRPPGGALGNLGHLALVIAVYVLYVLPVLGSTSVLPSHDNMYYHIPTFVYFGSAVSYGYGFPMWDPSFGGIPVGVTSVSLFPFLPHRLIGYWLYALLPLDAGTLYKLTLVVGMLGMAAGWWIFLHRVSSSRIGATMGSLMVLLGGSGITVFHQEQILATMTWTPWAMLALLAARRNLMYLPVAAVLVGFSMTVHYPQIQLISVLFLGVALLATGRLDSELVKGWVSRKALAAFAVSLVVFALAASPAFYIDRAKDDFSSPLRASEDIRPGSLEDYLRINRQQMSSAPFSYISNYALPSSEGMDDRFTAYVTYAGLALAAFGAYARRMRAMPALLLLLLFFWASLGVNAYLPQALFVMKFPFIAYFRQWYHFLPFANLCLSVLGAFGAAAIAEKLAAVQTRKAVLWLSAAVVIVLMFLDGSLYFGKYHHKKLINNAPVVAKPAEGEILSLLRTGQFSWALNRFKFFMLFKMNPIVTYREWFRLATGCPEAVVNVPYRAGAVFDPSGVGPEGADGVLGEFCGKGFASLATIADLGTEGGGSGVSGVYALSGGGVLPDPVGDLGGNSMFPLEDYLVFPSGAYLRGRTEGASLVVFPFCYKLGLEPRVNGRHAPSYPAMFGAMTAVEVPGGDFEIVLDVPFSGYQASLLVQAGLLALILIFTFGLYYWRGRGN